MGMKSFKLSPSNFKQWRGDGIESSLQLSEQLKLLKDSTKEGARTEDILYELLLKFGQELTAPVASLDVAGKRVFSVDDGGLLFVLDDFSRDMIQPLVAREPREIVALDALFRDGDRLKSNLELQCRDAGIRLVSV